MLAVATAFVSCNDEDNADQNSVVFETDFNNVASNKITLGTDDAVPTVDGWSAVFAEYPEGEQAFYELESGLKNLPEPLDQAKKAFMLSGNNHSDALQMWLVKQLSGLEANSKYKVEVELELASKYPDGSVGIGGSPGNSVHLVSKFAAEGYTLEKGSDKGDNVKLTLKKAAGVPESVLEFELGDVSTNIDQYVYRLINRKKSSDAKVVSTDSQGKLWAVIGTWSGFEGISTLYYIRIKMVFTKV